MKRLRNSLALTAGKVTSRVMHLSGRSSTALPGYVAERISRDPLVALMKKRRYAGVILVTGTNGKTTTTLMIKNILQQANYEVVNNGSGSNLSRGVLTALLSDRRQGDRTMLLLEVDEASMPDVVRATLPTHVVVTNIFRDQLDRYGEVDYTRRLIEKSLESSPATELVLCADDPHVARLGLRAEHVRYFGLDVVGLKALAHDHASDVPVSPETGSPLHYNRRYFGHFGHYQADDKSFTRPKPGVVVTKYSSDRDGALIDLKLYGKTVSMQLGLQGIYSAYNVAAAAAIGEALGLQADQIIRGITTTKAAFGRQEIVRYRESDCAFHLVKNPTGFNQVIQSELVKNVGCPVLIVINDNFADGRDVSWLWDVAIEDIASDVDVTVSGLRAYDMALRLEYAGLRCHVIEDPVAALDELTRDADRVLVLPTYTALLELRKKMNLKLEHQS